jgi:hypothetical protein
VVFIVVSGSRQVAACIAYAICQIYHRSRATFASLQHRVLGNLSICMHGILHLLCFVSQIKSINLGTVAYDVVAPDAKCGCFAPAPRTCTVLCFEPSVVREHYFISGMR